MHSIADDNNEHTFDPDLHLRALSDTVRSAWFTDNLTLQLYRNPNISTSAYYAESRTPVLDSPNACSETQTPSPIPQSSVQSSTSQAAATKPQFQYTPIKKSTAYPSFSRLHYLNAQQQTLDSSLTLSKCRLSAPQFSQSAIQSQNPKSRPRIGD